MFSWATVNWIYFTFQEAYVKALGRGFSAAPFNTFTIRFRPVTPKGEIRVLKDTDKKVFDTIADTITFIERTKFL